MPSSAAAGPSPSGRPLAKKSTTSCAPAATRVRATVTVSPVIAWRKRGASSRSTRRTPSARATSCSCRYEDGTLQQHAAAAPRHRARDPTLQARRDHLPGPDDALRRQSLSQPPRPSRRRRRLPRRGVPVGARPARLSRADGRRLRPAQGPRSVHVHDAEPGRVDRHQRAASSASSKACVSTRARLARASRRSSSAIRERSRQTAKMFDLPFEIGEGFRYFRLN